MGLSSGKKVGWALLSLGSGGTLLFGVAVLTIRELPRLNEEIWLWPITSTLLAVCAAFFLRRAYRREPSTDSRWFHFSLLDLTFSTALSGGLVGLLQSICGPEFLLHLFVPIGFLMVVLLLVGTSIANSRKLQGWHRYGYAIAFVAIAAGLLGVGGLAAVSIAGLHYENWSFPIRLVANVVGFDADMASQPKRLFLPFLRLLLPCLPAGLLLRWVVLRAGQSDDAK